jgi:Tfp pilus assembly protein PilP
MKKIIFISSVLLALTACAEKEQTVDWYEQNETERKAMIEKCKNNPGRYQNNPNCINAYTASDRLSWKSRKF